MRPEQDEYRLVHLADSGLGGDAVLEFWRREGALAPGTDERARLGEVCFIALDGDGQVAGVSTVYLKRNEQLRAEMWHQRGFVGRDHRRSTIGALMLREDQKYLEGRFVSGEDTRGPGMLLEVASPELRAGLPQAIWEADWAPGVRFTFIGENRRGDHLRVHWFAGAQTP